MGNQSETLSPFKCKHCAHCQKWECGSKFFFYCGLRKSNRTDNGLLKIKFNNEACLSFKKDTT